LVTVHDLIPLLQLQGELPGEPGRIGKHLIERGQRMLSAAAGVTAVSASTQKDLVGSTGRTDVVVVAHPVRSLPDPDTVHDLPPRYLFHVGNNAEYKNRLGVLDVFAKLQDIPDLHLLMAGEPPTGALLRRAAELERVRFLTHVTDAQLAALYQSAAILIFPSLYEGFGMPVLEAMAAGCPVVCSSAASLPEVAGGAAMLAAAGDVETTANHCRILLEDSALYDSLVVRGLQWSQQFTMARFARELREWFSTICF
jgi:glycosyltransferase involved in cell wall biosynthesis